MDWRWLLALVATPCLFALLVYPPYVDGTYPSQIVPGFICATGMLLVALMVQPTLETRARDPV